MNALDLFCGAGGASAGLAAAGFDVVGVDHVPQPRYPFKFVLADALAPPFDLDAFDLIWASPPCLAYTGAAERWRQDGREYPDLISEVRDLLDGRPGATIIENVSTAPIRADVVLDGTMFRDLRVIRKRHFELNFFMLAPSSGRRAGLTRGGGFVSIAGRGRPTGIPKSESALYAIENRRSAMGVPWMRGHREVANAIPPAFAEFIALAALKSGRGRNPTSPSPDS